MSRMSKGYLKFLFPILFFIVPACTTDEKQPSMLVINVLDDQLYADAHLAGSINVPFEDLQDYAQELDRNKPIAVYCSNYACTSSAQAWRILKDMGFNSVWAYEGGTAEWYQQGLPIEGPAKECYLKIKMEPFSEQDSENEVQVITAHDLAQKMKEHGLLVS